ncbi:MAG TPA: ATP synthase F0 subunit B [Terriglobales bacterium]|nr:ATP synthase F0 subunit B [Terriglobales bacterium]
MGQIFDEVGQAFVQSIPTIIFITILLFVLRRLVFGPVGDVLKTRDEQTKGALIRARERAALAGTKAEEYEAAWQRARQEIYAVREADRRAALAARDDIIRQARERAEGVVKDARASLAAQGEAARRELLPASQGLAEEIASTILAGPSGGLTSGAGTAEVAH